jgi:DNA-binding MarR family transcriptional regulator
MKTNTRKVIHDTQIVSSPDRTHTWTFLSNHAQALLCIARDPEVRIRDIAQVVGITERAAQRIVADLIATEYVDRERIGRRNHYRLNSDVKMRHAAQADLRISELLDAFS